MFFNLAVRTPRSFCAATRPHYQRRCASRVTGTYASPVTSNEHASSERALKIWLRSSQNKIEQPGELHTEAVGMADRSVASCEPRYLGGISQH